VFKWFRRIKDRLNPHLCTLAFLYASVFIDVHHPCIEKACTIRKKTPKFSSKNLIVFNCDFSVNVNCGFMQHWQNKQSCQNTHWRENKTIYIILNISQLSFSPSNTFIIHNQIQIFPIRDALSLIYCWIEK